MKGIKPYFVKYLPEEGEGTEYDQYIFKVGGVWGKPADFDSLLGPGIQEVKLVKKWLCSSDLQIGDLAFMRDREEAGTVADEDDLAYWRSRSAFRLIARISEDAVWVGEYDELDDKEVKGINNPYKGKQDPDKKSSYTEISLNRDAINAGLVDFVQVLNRTCRHFH